MTLREVFHNTKRGQLYRYLHFPKPASEWTLDIDVLVEEPDPNEPDDGSLVFPHPVAAGYHSTVFSSDIEHIVNYADTLSKSTDDNVRLDALRYYYDHGHLVFEDWHPRQREETPC